MSNEEKPGIRRWLIVLALLGFFGLVVAVSIYNRASSVGEKIQDSATRDTWPVKVMTVKESPFVSRILTSGILQPLEEASLAAEVSARVLSIKADMGDLVKKDQELVRLDDSAYALNLEAAKAQLAQAASQADLAADVYKRKEALAKDGHVSVEVLDNARATAQSARAMERSAQASLNLARRNVQETSIRSPFAGHVSTRHISPGNLVSPGVPVISVVQDGVMRVDLALSEGEIGHVKKDMTALVRIPTMQDKSFTGKVTRIGAAADRASGAFPVRVEIDNSDHKLLSGMRCDVEIVLSTIPSAVVVTRDHVVKENGDQGVYVAVEAEGKHVAKFSPVKTGESQGQTLQVLSGLEEGSLLVVVGQQSIKDGIELDLVEMDGRKIEKKEAPEKIEEPLDATK